MKHYTAVLSLLLVWTCAAYGSEGVTDVIRLQQSDLDAEVVLAFVQSSRVAYDLSADDILRLEDAHVPPTVILAMIERGNQLRENPEFVVPAEGRADISLFYEALAPYGTWSQEPDQGWVWEPTDAVRSTTWRPYANDGHWTWTNHGWYWESSTPYGWAVFHYGRWGYNSRQRWSWSPDNVWGPAWVDWRESEDHIGWAPLPFGSRYQAGAGFSFHGKNVGLTFNFGLEERQYAFVPSDRFMDINLGVALVSDRRRRHVYQQTRIVNNSYVYNDNRIINNGVSNVVIARATRRPIERVTVIDANAFAGQSVRGELRRDNTIVSYRPHIANVASIEPTAIVERQREAAKRASSEPSNREAARKRLQSQQDSQRRLEAIKEKAQADRKAELEAKRSGEAAAAEERKDAENDAAEARSEARKNAQEKDKEAQLRTEQAKIRDEAERDAKRAGEMAATAERKAAADKAALDRKSEQDATDRALAEKERASEHAKREAKLAGEKSEAEDRKEAREKAAGDRKDALEDAKAASAAEKAARDGKLAAQKEAGQKAAEDRKDALEKRDEANTAGKDALEAKRAAQKSAAEDKRDAHKEAVADRKEALEAEKQAKREEQEEVRSGAQGSK